MGWRVLSSSAVVSNRRSADRVLLKRSTYSERRPERAAATTQLGNYLAGYGAAFGPPIAASGCAALAVHAAGG